MDSMGVLDDDLDYEPSSDSVSSHLYDNSGKMKFFHFSILG